MNIFMIIVIGQIICGVWNLLKTLLFNSKLTKGLTDKLNNKKDSNLVIVIPCLREQDIICNTIDYFLDISASYDNIKVVIVTTEKEEYEKGESLRKIDLLVEEILKGQSISSLANKYNEIISINGINELIKYKTNKKIVKIAKDKIINSKTTSKIVEEYISKIKSDKVVHIHYPRNQGIMADQLNYVLEKYKFDDDSNTYFSVYNADSTPGKSTFENVFKTIEINNKPQVMQQYSYAYSNISELSYIMKGFALYQSNFEIKYGLVNSIVLFNFLYTYVVGHGMYFRLDTLKELGGFDSHFWCEDIFISSVLRNKNINIAPIFSLECMETPKFLNIQIKQNAVWFKTSNQWIKMIKCNLKIKPKLSMSSVNWFLQRIRMNLSWLLLPFLVLYSFVYPIIIKDYSLLVLAIFSYLSMQAFTYFTTLFIIEKIERKRVDKKIINFGAVCLSTLISNMGPIYSLFNVKMKKYKTVR